MAVIENRFVCDLSKPVQAQALKGNVFSLDNLGSRISVLIYENGQPATISGSITANCILPDGSTVNVNGSLTTENGGSKAYVDVPQSCLLITGILKIAIKCTSASVITTLAAIVANVYMTKTDNVITPSQQIINDWNAEISAAIATQNAAIANQDTKINDLKSAFTISGAETNIASDLYFIQGTPGTPTDANRCTTGYIKCFPGDVIKITGNASGQKYRLRSATGLDGWKTSDFEYNVTTESNYWVDVATTDGNTPISPSDITTLKVIINGVLNIRESLMRDYPISMEKGSIAGGTPSNSDYYCRSSEFCTACKGALLKIVNNTGFVLSNLNIYLYNERTTESYSTAYSIPNAGGGIGIGETLKYKIPAFGYFKIRVSKPGASVAMTQNDIDLLNTCFSYERMYLDERVINSTEKSGSLWDRMNGNVQYRLEIGGISGGTPSPSTNYVRNKHFIKANIGDVFTIKPNGFTVNGGSIYKYKAPITTAYDKNTSIATTASGKTFTYTFDEECYFKIRAAKNNYETLTDDDIIAFESAITFNHQFGQSDFEQTAENSVALPLDYDTIRSGMSGKINIALQTDTHMELFDGYKKTDGSIFQKSDFIAFASILKSIEQVKPDVFVNLGDIVRGYEFDPDYETRASIDRIISDYAKYISSPQMYLIGNHDDGNMWYFDTRYNQKQNVDNVLYPNEQFNRITKFGVNNGKDQNYFYRDIGGIRFIVLWQKDFNYSLGIPQNEDFAIGADQLSWLENTALDTSLPVVVMTHAPLIASLYEHGGTGFTDTVDLLKAFENGGGTVIAVLSGHTHAQNSAQADGINHIVFANGYTWFELISIDLTNRTITCKAINKTLSDITYSF